MKVAIIHYWFITRRGGEKVVESILKIYPEADIYTLFYDIDTYGDYLKGHNIYTSKYNTPFFRKHYQKIFPLYPSAVKSLKLKEDYDLIISSESGPAKGIKINKKAKHICYIHSPMRYCWGYTDTYLKSINPFLRPIANFFFNRLKNWDKTTIENVELYIANSLNVAKRVQHFYNKEAKVVYPPIAQNLFKKPLNLKIKKEYFLSFGAITPYKKVDLLVDCFNKNGEKLIIIGNGSEKEKLVRKANKNIQFKGFLEASELEHYIQKSKALVFPGEEDFGMIPLEVMSFGIPVIAYKKGGALETVVENKDNIQESSGIFFEEQNLKSLQNALDFFKTIEKHFNPLWIRNHAKKFEEQNFLKHFKYEVKKMLQTKEN
ncbi:glycosyl transferase [Polaribacter sp. ALD11]|uniref:glycosyltransferase n=1 Tax=Polaribacter sp. ALD11 TaxID=2058137 RepID=UPI000C309192|nr:glycosyltransferase [Polaribacter sp. ALD11]AUC85506.1 glycosyl transferase [Polaribacter sp. ALD11]